MDGGRQVLLKVTNQGGQAEFEAEVTSLTGVDRAPPLPWNIKWREAGTVARRPLLQGSSGFLELVELDRQAGIDYVHGHYRNPPMTFLTPMGERVVLPSGLRDREDLEQRTVTASVRVSSVVPEAAITRHVRVGFSSSLEPRVQLFDPESDPMFDAYVVLLPPMESVSGLVRIMVVNDGPERAFEAKIVALEGQQAHSTGPPWHVRWANWDKERFRIPSGDKHPLEVCQRIPPVHPPGAVIPQAPAFRFPLAGGTEARVVADITPAEIDKGLLLGRTLAAHIAIRALPEALVAKVLTMTFWSGVLVLDLRDDP